MAWNCQAKGENTYRVVHTHDRHARIIVQQLENGRQSLGLEISELKKKNLTRHKADQGWKRICHCSCLISLMALYANTSSGKNGMKENELKLKAKQKKGKEKETKILPLLFNWWYHYAIYDVFSPPHKWCHYYANASYPLPPPPERVGNSEIGMGEEGNKFESDGFITSLYLFTV